MGRIQILELLLTFGFQPSRLVGGRHICSDDDLFVLNLAKDKNGIVVSLDQFRDAYVKTRDREIKEVIKNRWVALMCWEMRITR